MLIFIYFLSNIVYKDFIDWICEIRKVGFFIYIERVEIVRVSKEFIEKNFQIIEEKSNYIVVFY